MVEHNIFQTTDSGEQQLLSILSRELDSFNSVLDFSQKIVDQVGALPLAALSQMVQYRQEWIEKIQALEQQRKKLALNQKDDDIEYYMKMISAAAQKLVDIDKKIFENLRMRKIQFAKQHADLVSSRQIENKLHDRPNRLDIKQG